MMKEILRTLETGNFLNLRKGIHKNSRVYIIYDGKRWNDFFL